MQPNRNTEPCPGFDNTLKQMLKNPPQKQTRSQKPKPEPKKKEPPK